MTKLQSPAKPPAMCRNLMPHRGLLGLILAGVASVCAQTPPTLENDVRNILSQQPSSAWPPPPPSIVVDPRTPTANQFRAGTVIGDGNTDAGITAISGAMTRCKAVQHVASTGIRSTRGNRAKWDRPEQARA